VAGAITQAGKLGTAGTLYPALRDIFDQTGALVIVVRAESKTKAKEAEQRAAVIQAMEALTESKGVTGYQPRILIATGYSEDDGVAKALETYAAKLRAVAYIDSPSMATPQDVVQRRASFGGRVELLRPRVSVTDDSGQTVFRPYSARAAGLRARIDYEKGWWWSKSNQDVMNITGLEQVDTFILGEQNCTANLLNMENISTIIRHDGFKHWGNRLCTSHSQWRFEPVRRTADVIEDSIQEAMLPYVDRPLDRDVADDILGSINAYMRQLKNLGAIHGGSAWLNDELNTAETLAAGQLYIDYDFGPKSPLERLTLRAMINNKLALEELTV
ncbi:phage tail sheath subtilisin-like domain-containing protein, partial [Escherichia coli]|nr:phage tail sheath subtilisin-like domain-containing protein [Escherichia coli]